jgi:hypothetical protein
MRQMSEQRHFEKPNKEVPKIEDCKKMKTNGESTPRTPNGPSFCKGVIRKQAPLSRGRQVAVVNEPMFNEELARDGS